MSDTRIVSLRERIWKLPEQIPIQEGQEQEPVDVRLLLDDLLDLVEELVDERQKR